MQNNYISIDVIPEANQIIALKLINKILSFNKNYFLNVVKGEL